MIVVSAYAAARRRLFRAACALTAFAANRRHVFAVLAHLDATFAPGHARLFGTEDVRPAALMGNLAAFASSHARLFATEFMRRAMLMRGFTTLARDLTTALLIHRGKPTTFPVTHAGPSPSPLRPKLRRVAQTSSFSATRAAETIARRDMSDMQT
jgi:hypothetical protein